MALKSPPVAVVEGTVPCAEAREALTLAIFSLFCLGFILGPVAISKALKARAIIQADPELTGSGKVTAAIIIGAISVVIWVLNIFAKVSGH